jgi:hypothetical protein
MASPLFVASLIVDIRSDLYQQGTTEDGEPELFESYCVTVESQDGFRWQHTKAFLGHLMGDADAKYECEDLALKVVRARDAGTWKGPVGNPHWVSIQPCYGSPAYGKNWKAYAAQDELADGNFDTQEREEELRALASFA